jgi:hypothetical protein
VRAIVATHWHDDHVRGMAEQLIAFPKARFCASSALTNKEFLTSVIAYDNLHNITCGSGASELLRVLEILRTRAGASSPVRACPGRPIVSIDQTLLLPERIVRTLTPSDKQFDLFLQQIAQLLPKPLQTKTRVPDQSPNNISVALHISIGDQAILLGADLEECGDPELGWSAIVLATECPSPKAQIFKIPHHGSANGHCDAVWRELLVPNPMAIITPWNRNKGLPRPTDVSRISNLTHSGFCTSAGLQAIGPPRAHSVEKQIKETVGQIRATQMRTGWVRIRNGGRRNSHMWSIEISPDACALSDWRQT